MGGNRPHNQDAGKHLQKKKRKSGEISEREIFESEMAKEV